MHLQGSQTLDLRGLLFPLNHSPENYSNWSLQPVLPRPDFFTKEIHRLLQGGVNGLPAVAEERRLVAVPSAALGTAGL